MHDIVEPSVVCEEVKALWLHHRVDRDLPLFIRFCCFHKDRLQSVVAGSTITPLIPWLVVRGQGAKTNRFAAVVVRL